MRTITPQEARRVAVYEPTVRRIATRHNLDAPLVLAVIGQESGGDPYAIRVERGFWRRYGSSAIAIFRRTASSDDDKWGTYPDLASTSYGLMQVMYVVAIERGMALRFPTQLCDPVIGIEAGCRHLRYCLDHTANNPTKALLRYNGGGDPDYPNKVFAWRSATLESLRNVERRSS